ncbi:MAG: methylated-DNA--[protein]-cysteine S-methyltransferase [Saprospiraceae bacterium]|nr:methylated-DNA--[protein]-cysteine S-methyltransferase [Saprospiraceae bacterium]
MQVSNSKEVEKYYNALVEKDEKYVGIFYAGVKTTGIFCISTCRARKPKFENVEFYTDVKDLLRHGYRPCKICKPTQNANEPPEEVSRALKLLHDSEERKLSDSQIRDEGLSPEKIRRWFKRHHGVTFQAYQRMIRINMAYQELKSGHSVTDSAFSSGYNSLSGFGYTFKKLVGKTPGNSQDKSILLIQRFTTPLGPMFACSTDKGICLLEFTDRRMLETEFEDLQKRLNAVILSGENDHLKQLKQELAEYFQGARTEFEVSLDTPTTPFRQKVWDMLVQIPFGKTASYKEQALKIGNPKAVRAVASANGHNRVAIVIPCHRVIGSDGSLTGYAGGLDRKKWLLELEGSYQKSNQLEIFDQ